MDDFNALGSTFIIRRCYGGIKVADDVIRCFEKNTTFKRPVKESLATLYNLLAEKRYVEVRKALEDKGMRSGFTCLFYGSPGTGKGKTESVYQLAKKTIRDILMADVSKLKSMWVGESEKNLKMLFTNYKNLAETSSVTPILLFTVFRTSFFKRWKL